MSCLALSELPLSEQIAIELQMARHLDALTHDVFAIFESPAETPHSPCALVPVHPAGDSIPLDSAAARPLPPPLPGGPAVESIPLPVEQAA